MEDDVPGLTFNSVKGSYKGYPFTMQRDRRGWRWRYRTHDRGRWLAGASTGDFKRALATIIEVAPRSCREGGGNSAARVRRHGGRHQAAKSRSVGERSRVCQPSTRRMVI
jgi:hypothetical protein